MPQNTQYVFKFGKVTLLIRPIASECNVSIIEKWPLKDHRFFGALGMCPFTFSYFCCLLYPHSGT